MGTVRFDWSKLKNVQLGDDYRYAIGMGAPLMLGWTALLLWAGRKPLERTGILPITLLVVLGEVLMQVWGLAVGFVSPGALVPTFVLQAFIFSLLLFSCLNVRRVE